MAALEAVAAFVGAFGFLAFLSPGLAYQIAMFASIALKADTDAIYSRMPSVFDREWACLAAVTAASFSWVMLTHSVIPLVATLIGIFATTTYVAVRSHQQMKIAAERAGLQYPAVDAD